MSVRDNLQPALARALICWTIGMVFFFGEGIVFDLTPWAQAIISATTSLGYPETGHAETVVVLMRDEDRRTHAKGIFPIPYDVHAKVLDFLRESKPRAVFIDFGFVRVAEDVVRVRKALPPSTNEPGSAVGVASREPPAEFKTLIDAVCALHDSGTHVFFVDPTTLGLPDVDRLLFRHCATPVGAFVDKAHVASGVLKYPISDGNAAAPTTVRGSAPLEGLSAAIALFVSKDEGSELKRRDHSMALVWPARRPPGTVNMTRKELCELSNCFCTRADADEGKWTQLLHLFEHGPSDLRRVCAWSSTRTVDDFFAPMETAGGRTTADLPPNATVFYGGDIALASDSIRSPVFSPMPAVYYHATAYDNLVAFNGRPKWSPQGPEMALLALTLFAVTAALVWSQKAPGRRARALVTTIVLVAYAALAYFELAFGDVETAVVFGALLMVLAIASLVAPSGSDEHHVHAASERAGRRFVRQIVHRAAIGALVVAVAGTIVIHDIVTLEEYPERVLLACFALYIFFRCVTEPTMALIAVACFAASLLLFQAADISFDRFLSTIFYFEVVRWSSEMLSHAAERARACFEPAVRRTLSRPERAALLVLQPFATPETSR